MNKHSEQIKQRIKKFHSYSFPPSDTWIFNPSSSAEGIIKIMNKANEAIKIGIQADIQSTLNSLSNVYKNREQMINIMGSPLDDLNLDPDNKIEDIINIINKESKD